VSAVLCLSTLTDSNWPCHRLDVTEREQRRIADTKTRRARCAASDFLFTFPNCQPGNKKQKLLAKNTHVQPSMSLRRHSHSKRCANLPRKSRWMPRPKTRSLVLCSLQCRAAAPSHQTRRKTRRMARMAGHSAPSRSCSSRPVHRTPLDYGARHAGSMTARDAPACARHPSIGLTTPVAIFFLTARVAAGSTALGVHVHAPNPILSWSTGDI
jgi:hypothetical protein